MPDALLSVEDVHTYYGDSHVLQGVSFEVPRGGVVALLGRNGAGKTTTLRSIMRLTPPKRGAVRFEGRPLAGLPAYRVARAGVALERVPAGVTVPVAGVAVPPILEVAAFCAAIFSALANSSCAALR